MQTMDVLPVVVNNRTLIPIRFVAYALGADVDWIRPTEDTSSLAQIVLNGRELLIPLDGTITPELANLGMDVPAQIIDDRTMVPLRFVSEFFGALVNWDGETSEIEIIRDTSLGARDSQTSTPLATTSVQTIATLPREDEDDLIVTFAA
ncbi:MAG: copper amine oxidase N-terminal domain-containing protein [Defluviitaleaceae bacterium]|nr:copper amine oxidase N-terminal domain-containing protein [Defluviitaleaceae bacterium]